MLRHGILNVELSARRGTNEQTPHTQDKVSVVVKGTGYLRHGSAREHFTVGDLRFVPAGVDQRFEDFSEDLLVWLVFYGPQGDEGAV